MSSLLAADAASARRTGTADATPARAFLGRYVRAVAVTLVSSAVVLIGWGLLSTGEWVSDHPWSTAGAATLGWVLAVGGWLRRRGWRRATVHAVTWAAPTALLLPLVGIGWVLPVELILWGPLTSLFGVACAVAADPMGVDVPEHARLAPDEELIEECGWTGWTWIDLDGFLTPFLRIPDLPGVGPAVASAAEFASGVGGQEF
jgi:hypothetical protein